MRRRFRFRPAVADRLEARTAPSGFAHIRPVAVHPVTFRVARAGLQAQVVTQVNQAFDSFTEDYLRAQATYVAAVGAGVGNTATPQYNAFLAYIDQRVRLLGEQLVAAFGSVPGGLNYVPSGPFGGGSLVVQSFLNRQINGALRTALRGNIPGSNDPQTVTLYTLNATTAINTARDATLNGIQFLTNHTFHNGHKPH
ncbi:MAG TPA: hypothetical protein VG406_17680 [Isosphaeraceae bacterium]|jgi:hypothetical protein|nr:hypothetical protein [Isosphaeraceae bacterium]